MQYPDEDDRTIVTAQEPCEGDKVSIMGRTSGITSGVVNGVQSCISHDEMGSGLTSMEWTVVENHPGRRFSRRGDSGAFVISRGIPSVIGLFWGGSDSGLFDTSYFTPIGVVAKDILKKADYHVRLLGGNHICC